MQTFRKGLSLLLVLCMVVGMMPAVFAQDTGEEETGFVEELEEQTEMEAEPEEESEESAQTPTEETEENEEEPVEKPEEESGEEPAEEPAEEPEEEPEELSLGDGQEPISYIYRWWDDASQSVQEEERTVTDYLKIGPDMPQSVDGSEWIVVAADCIDDGYAFGLMHHDCNIILMDGVTLTVKTGIAYAGGKFSISIFGQREDTGKLITTGRYDEIFDLHNAGISIWDGWDGHFNIHGGDITTTGSSRAAGIGNVRGYGGSTINVYGGKLKAYGGQDGGAGIGCADSEMCSTFNLYGGTVEAYGGQNGGAGVGGCDMGIGGNVNIYGGSLKAVGGNGAAGIGGGITANGGNISIHGGTVDASGSQGGAGIGGGVEANSGYITITGGTVTAHGSDRDPQSQGSSPEGGAGIGGGARGSNGTFTMSGGNVTAEGGMLAAAIGGGFMGDSGDMTISGGTITATGGIQGAGIGGGSNGAVGKISISDATITATGGRFSAGIGGGTFSSGGDIWIQSGQITASSAYGTGSIGSGNDFTAAANVSLGTGTVFLYGADAASADEMVSQSDADIDSILREQAYARSIHLDPISYISRSWDGTQVVDTPITLEKYRIVTADTTELDDGRWYAVTADTTIPIRLNAVGQTNLILADGVTLTMPQGIHIADQSKLAIYGQTADSGKLVCKAPDKYCGIGSGADASVVIFGGDITATGGAGGSGIGATQKAGGDVTVYGGIVSAFGGDGGAGIGGGPGAAGGKIALYGGKITAAGAGGGAGIGGGKDGTAGEVTLSDSVVLKCGADAEHADTTVTDDDENCGEILNGYAYAERFESEAVPYIYREQQGGQIIATQKEVEEFILLTPKTTELHDGKWYVVQEDITVDNPMTVYGSASLILCDGVTLTAQQGVLVTEGNELTVYGQAGDSGTLAANGQSSEDETASTAGIGSGYQQRGGVLHILGGRIRATGGKGSAGIGGGSGGAGVSFDILGGTVQAVGGAGGAGIGGGAGASNLQLTISGGTVNAVGGEGGAGLGGGRNGKCPALIIDGGTITATGGAGGAGIGGGAGAGGGIMSICNAVITAIGGENAASIGGGENGSPTSFLNIYGPITFSYGADAAHADKTISTEDSSAGEVLNGAAYAHAGAAAVSYVSRQWDGSKVVETEVTTEKYTVVDASTTVWTDGVWYLVNSDVTIDDRITVNGFASLILADGASLTAPKGIDVSGAATLDIYGQSGDSGKLETSAEDSNSSLGGAYSEESGNIVIHGGQIIATGGNYSTAIGSGYGGTGGSAAILGGAVNATGGAGGASIGAGMAARGGTVTICGGTVNAVGGEYSAGIGGGTANQDAVTVIINGGNVTATGGTGDAGIGGGEKGVAADVTLGEGVVIRYGADAESANQTVKHGDDNIGEVLNGAAYAQTTTSSILPTEEWQYNGSFHWRGNAKKDFGCHTYGEPVWNWAKNKADTSWSLSYTRKCSKCGYETKPVNVKLESTIVLGVRITKPARPVVIGGRLYCNLEKRESILLNADLRQYYTKKTVQTVNKILGILFGK